MESSHKPAEINLHQKNRFFARSWVDKNETGVKEEKEDNNA
ncbi:hypothetical protein [Carboxydothermus pertinax]|uniref:Uncharacterized protein n=1 Tax=Carboxydothermus pertinax TaxID=870242 RepID=A0A1L8CUV0_9THEO|nr:hypothetical protein [Carboxydothermus pertinax]GAV22706.1 hypothetical protein cpu_12160 [Carboxydothermus pertinax]